MYSDIKSCSGLGQFISQAPDEELAVEAESLGLDFTLSAVLAETRIAVEADAVTTLDVQLIATSIAGKGSNDQFGRGRPDVVLSDEARVETSTSNSC